MENSIPTIRSIPTSIENDNYCEMDGSGGNEAKIRTVLSPPRSTRLMF